MRRIVRRHVRGFVQSVRGMDWFDWFWLSFVVFVGFLFRLVAGELMKMFNP